jgi:hypothetical protein
MKVRKTLQYRWIYYRTQEYIEENDQPKTTHSGVF